MKTVIWIIIIAVAATGIWFLFFQQKEPSTEGLLQLPEVSDNDTTAQIMQDLDGINLGDINQEFEAIDAELNNL